MTVYYFKTKEDVVRYGISPNEIFDDDPQCIPITEEEYNKAIIELEANAKLEENAHDEISAEEFMLLLEEAL